MNTREIKNWLSDIAFKRLCFAILISTLLHLGLIGKFGFLTLPKNDDVSHIIEARLVKVLPKPEKALSKMEVLDKVVPKKVEAKPKEIFPEPQALPTIAEAEVLEELPPPYVPPEIPAESTQSEAEVASSIVPLVHIATAEDENPLEESEYAFPIEEKPLPYQYIDTKFDIYANEDQAKAGEAEIVYEATQNKKYSLKWEVEATGLLSLFYPDLVQTSHGRVSEHGLRPDLYQYQFGNKEDKSYVAEFNWSDGLVALKSSKGEKSEHLSENTQDFLSFMYQFMFVPPLSNMQVSMTNGKRVTTYDYTFVGEEQLDLAFADVKTYHIQHAKVDSDDKTDLWLAVDYHYIPVKIRKTEKNGTVITQIATSIKMQDQIEDRTNDPRFITPSGDAPH